MSQPEPPPCVTCGGTLDGRCLLCPECQQFTPRGLRLMTRWGIAFAVVFVPLLLFLVLNTFRPQ